MIDRAKKLQARFYELPSGRKPVREWLLELPEDDRREIGKDIQKVEFGWRTAFRLADRSARDFMRCGVICKMGALVASSSAS